jgi:tetratricopeptide (TPR) repeat protein
VAALALSYAALRPPVPPEAHAAVPVVSPPVTPFDHAWQLAQKGKHGPAAAEFVALGEVNKDGRAYGFAAYCLTAGKNRPQDVIVVADEAIRLGYRTAPTYANRAYNHFKANNPAAAKADCDEALRLDPNLPAALYTRATVRLQMHITEGVALPPEAIADIERATTAMPDAPEVWNHAAQIYFRASADRPDLRNRAIRAVGNAVLAGKDAGAIKRNPVLEPLVGDPAFETSLTLRPRAVAPQTNPHLASPIP